MFRGSFLGSKKLEKRLSEVSDAYSDSDDDEHDIAAALSEAQLKKDSKPPSFRDLLASPRDYDDDDDDADDYFDEPSASHHDADGFSVQETTASAADYDDGEDDVEIPVDDLFQTEVKGHVFEKGEFQVSQGELFGSLGDIGHTSFSSTARSPRKVISMQPFMVSQVKSSKMEQPQDDFDDFNEEDGHDSFDFSVVKFSPQAKKKGKVALGKHFAAMTQTELINEDGEEEEEEVSIAEFSGQWQTMQEQVPAPSLLSPVTPSHSRGSVLRRSSYETPKSRTLASRTLTSRSKSFEKSPFHSGSRSVPATPVATMSSESPTKRAQTTGTTRKKRSIKLKASALGLDDGASAADIKAALERVSPNQLKAALEKLIESDNDDDDDGDNHQSRGRRRPSSGSKSVSSSSQKHKERSRSKGSRSILSCREETGDDAAAATDPSRRRPSAARRSRSSHTKDGSKEKSRSHSSKSTKSSASRRSASKSDRRQSTTRSSQDKHDPDPAAAVLDDGFASPVSPTWSNSSSNSSSTAACTSMSSDSSFNVAPRRIQRSSLKDAQHRAQKPVMMANPFYGAFDD